MGNQQPFLNPLNQRDVFNAYQSQRGQMAQTPGYGTWGAAGGGGFGDTVTQLG
jgi:hypothetical protein